MVAVVFVMVVVVVLVLVVVAVAVALGVVVVVVVVVAVAVTVTVAVAVVVVVDGVFGRCLSAWNWTCGGSCVRVPTQTVADLSSLRDITVHRVHKCEDSFFQMPTELPNMSPAYPYIGCAAVQKFAKSPWDKSS